MTQIDELLRQTANAVERDHEADRRSIDRAHSALSAVIIKAATQEPQATRRQRGSRASGPLTGNRRRSTRLVLAGGIAAAGLAVAGVLGFQDSGLTPPSALAATMDRLAHLAVTHAWSGMPGQGQYLYTKSEGITLSGDGTRSLDQRQTWFPSSGHMLVSDPSAAGSGASNPSSVQSIGGPSSYFPTTVSGWQSLSTDPATLLQQIKNMDAPKAPDTPAEQFTAVSDALTETPIPPAVRAILYRAVALIPGVRLMGPQTDPTGQAGLGVGYYTNGRLQSELIFDQTTARLLSQLGYDQNGNVNYAWSFVQQQIVNNAPSAGSTPPATQFPAFRLTTTQTGGSGTTAQTTTTG